MLLNRRACSSYFERAATPFPLAGRRASRTLVAALMAVASYKGGLAYALTECTDICPGTGACTISSSVDVEPDSRLDCAGRDLTLTNSGALKVVGGELLLYADDLTLAGPGGLIHAVADSDGEPGGLDIQLTGDLTLGGKMRAHGGAGGGSINIVAAGDIVIVESGTDGIEADGTSAGASGGDVTLRSGGAITVNDPIHAEGASGGTNGGGTITIEAEGDVTIALDGHISAPGRSDGGGHVTIASRAGDVFLREHVDVVGKSTYGLGGTISVTAAGQVEVSEDMTAAGGINDGGGEAAGGTVEIEAGCGGVTIDAAIVTNGGQLGSQSEGGAIRVESAGGINVQPGGLLDARGLAAGGSGGTIELEAGEELTLAGGATLDARGSTTSSGQGGHVSLIGCTIALATTAKVDVSGHRGGRLTAKARGVAPDQGTQPLVIPSGAILKATSVLAGAEGMMELATLDSKKGECSNDALRACALDVDCTVGCQTGNCLYANPDTDGVMTQFDVAPRRLHNKALAACSTACVP